jgi:hypothetical protein
VELVCSKLVHAAAARAKSEAKPHARSWFFMRTVGSQEARSCGDGQYIRGRPPVQVWRACRGTCLTPAR